MLIFSPACLPDFGEIFDDLWQFLGEVDRLGTVFGQVIECPRALSLTHDFVVAADDCVGASVVEEVGVIAVGRATGQHRHE